MDLYIKKEGETTFTKVQCQVKEVKIIEQDIVVVYVNKDEVIVNVDNWCHAKYHIGQFINPPKNNTSKVKKTIDIQDAIRDIDQGAAKRRMELDPIDSFWDAIYENFRNIMKKFWGK